MILAPPPTPSDVRACSIDLQSGRVSFSDAPGESSPASPDSREEASAGEPESPPGSPTFDSRTRSNSWKRKRHGEDRKGSDNGEDMDARSNMVKMDACLLQQAELEVADVETRREQVRATQAELLDATIRRLEEAEKRLGKLTTAMPSHVCPLCLKAVQQSCVGSCVHHFCHACLLHAVASGCTSCPECHQHITSIRRDFEFDALLAPNFSEAVNSNTADSLLERYTRYLVLPPGTHAGITLSCRDSQGPGCLVTAVVPRDQAYKSGVRAGDILISINQMPCTQPGRVTALVDQLTRANTTGTATLIVLPQHSVIFDAANIS